MLIVKEYNLRGIQYKEENNSFCKYPNRMMVLLAVQDIELPSAFGNPDTKIKSLLMNKEQIQVVNTAFKSRKAILAGNFLSIGKFDI